MEATTLRWPPYQPHPADINSSRTAPPPGTLTLPLRVAPPFPPLCSSPPGAMAAS
jgi:hypothetical protein